jgi:hypothetical protein
LLLYQGCQLELFLVFLDLPIAPLHCITTYLDPPSWHESSITSVSIFQAGSSRACHDC